MCGKCGRLGCFGSFVLVRLLCGRRTRFPRSVSGGRQAWAASPMRRGAKVDAMDATSAAMHARPHRNRCCGSSASHRQSCLGSNPILRVSRKVVQSVHSEASIKRSLADSTSLCDGCDFVVWCTTGRTDSPPPTHHSPQAGGRAIEAQQRLVVVAAGRGGGATHT